MFEVRIYYINNNYEVVYHTYSIHKTFNEVCCSFNKFYEDNKHNRIKSFHYDVSIPEEFIDKFTKLLHKKYHKDLVIIVKN